MAVEIPLTSDGSQKLSTVLNNITYQLEVSYNTRVGVWTMNISRDGNELVNGIVLVGGVDILRQFTLAIENLYVVNTTNPNQDADGNNLGTDVGVFLLTEEEISEIG